MFALPKSLALAVILAALPQSYAAESYAAQLESLRSEISAKLPAIDDAARQSVVDAKDPKARVEAVRKLTTLDPFLTSNTLDAKLAKFFVLHEATPAGLDAFAAQGAEQNKLLETLLADEALLLQMAVADGARPLHANGKPAAPPNYGKAMETYTTIQQASPKVKQGVLQRLAVAVALEFSESLGEEGSSAIDPLKRFQHFQKAYEAGELDPKFDQLSTWELRFVVCAPESDEALAWGREMLRNFRPDHILTANEGGRYANLVNTDVGYGSLNTRFDRPELFGVQNILMNGGICGRRAFFARFICRAFGVPATARPSSGHGATARWTPEGWLVVLGPNWGHGWTTTRYKNDLNFLASTQARARGEEFLKVKRAWWIGDVMGEPRTHGERGNRSAPAFWNGVALATQGRIIEDAKVVTLDALGAELGEADGRSVADAVLAKPTTPEDRKIITNPDGAITIPAAAFTKPTGDPDEEGGSGSDAIPMKSFAGGMQVFLPRFSQLKPILVRGGSLRHEAELCESSTRHWRGRRPKKSQDLRGLRFAITPDDETEIQKEMKIDLGNGVTMDFIHIQPGTFTMGGSRNAKEGEALADTPRHEVTLSRGFYLGKTEVTQAQYQAITGRKIDEGPDHPVDGVKPFTALQVCADFSAKIGLEVRLPAEAEWEYAARAGTTTRYHFGDDPSKLGDYAWFKDNAGGKIQPVGQKKPNPWGLYDMYGNVAEYVRDEHHEDYYAQGSKVDPTGPSLGIHSGMQFTVDVPKAGDYTLTAKVVTSNVDQTLQLAVNGAETPTTIALPFTIGAWGESEPVTVALNQGTNILHFWRDQAPQYGVAVKGFTLIPVSVK
ncbi:MAG: SUMF1/EgtB/PvdO family nonheme iron enzyme [Luteolibacter sp.]